MKFGKIRCFSIVFISAIAFFSSNCQEKQINHSSESSLLTPSQQLIKTSELGSRLHHPSTITPLNIITKPSLTTPVETGIFQGDASTRNGNKVNVLSSIIAEILENPKSYINQKIEIVGYYRGWNQFNEASSGPPITRSDWVVADLSGALYVLNKGDSFRNENLPHWSIDKKGVILRVLGVVQINNNGQPYIVPISVEFIE